MPSPTSGPADGEDKKDDEELVRAIFKQELMDEASDVKSEVKLTCFYVNFRSHIVFVSSLDGEASPHCPPVNLDRR